MARAKSQRGSPLRDGVAFQVPETEGTAGGAAATDSYSLFCGAGTNTHTLQLPGRTASDSSEGASSSGSSRKRREKKARAEDGGQEKILIVLLDEKDNAEKTDKDKPDDDSTWHGYVCVPCSSLPRN